ncbi:helix-turn-helix transcriptional regulator [Devosia sp. 2618]|uniref:helix-turn-helix transcriptional regulator n=1 Tax=Devosia sp. 2618 TaxID=3156454 RepID=UPI003399961F
MSVVDRIYEAAFVPEMWPKALAEITDLSSSSSGAMLIVDRRLPPLYSATENVTDTLEAFAQSPGWYDNSRLHRIQRKNYSGFLEVSEFSTEEERRLDKSQQHMESLGISWQIGSAVLMPGGETVLFTFERMLGMARFSPEDVALFNDLRPHLARASLMAARLKLERAQASVDAMDAMGVPAAVILPSGVVITTNTLFEQLGDVLRPAAFGRLMARDRQANRLLQAAIPGGDQGFAPQTRSIPMQLYDGERAIVVHVIPLHRSASDVFDRGAALVAVTGYSVEGNTPSDAVLRGLFDLSPAEAGIATDLSSGQAIKDIATQRGVAVSTVRTHLAQIFRKTGTSQQGQLIALLKGISGYPVP